MTKEPMKVREQNRCRGTSSGDFNFGMKLSCATLLLFRKFLEYWWHFRMLSRLNARGCTLANLSVALSQISRILVALQNALAP